MNDTTVDRERMVTSQIEARGVRDPGVLAAMREVPREAFLPAELAEFAYRDSPLPIECGQTISQPYIVALMTEALALTPTDKVLEIGTGSGYAAAVLAEIAERVFTIERHADLAETAWKRLRTRYANVEVRCGDGTLGWLARAPFDAIVVTAAGPNVPQALLEQLRIGGRLVMPVGAVGEQSLVRVTRTGEDLYRREDIAPVTFVPLIGAQGWAA